MRDGTQRKHTHSQVIRNGCSRVRDCTAHSQNVYIGEFLALFRLATCQFKLSPLRQIQAPECDCDLFRLLPVMIQPARRDSPGQQAAANLQQMITAAWHACFRDLAG